MAVPLNRLRWTVAAAVATMLAAAITVSVPVQQITPAYASSGISQRLGIDSCPPSISQMRAFWDGTPYYNVGVYIGGADAGCPVDDTTYVNQLVDMGWAIMPLWVGPQPPCSAEPVRFSWDPGTAYDQGRNEAVAVWQKLREFGMDPNGTPVIYDIEGFNTGDTGCVNAYRSFMSGFVWQMHVAPAQKAGVYGSSCASGLASLASIPNVPDFVTGASWDGDRNTAALPCLGGLWVFNQRHKQYQGDHFETWNGVTLDVDSDCSNAPVYPAPDRLSVGQGCV